jgi:sterol desaturase/sphingolipid hydroxylase (fatty acid hydroxylase superfamily)
MFYPASRIGYNHLGKGNSAAMNPAYPSMTGFPHEVSIRIGFFLLIFGAVALVEIVAPRRRLNASKAGRWRVNLSLTIIDAVLARFLLPVLPVGLALYGAARGWGVLNHVSVPFWPAVFLSVLLLDLVIYLQHVLFHRLPLFWRIHRMHHTDLDIDVTTGLRFHPLEIILSQLIKLAAVAALGISAIAVLVFEILLNGTSQFNHGNVRLGERVDRLLRLIVVTPDMHRVHHSAIIREMNSNFGFDFPWWDRFLGTYRPQPSAGHEAMVIGLAQFREARALTLRTLLLMPFRLEGMDGRAGKGGRSDSEGGRSSAGEDAGSFARRTGGGPSQESS